MKLECAACGKLEKVDPAEWKGTPFYLCKECDELAKAWKAESERELKALKEERLARPRYACVRALLTYEPARLAAKVTTSAD